MAFLLPYPSYPCGAGPTSRAPAVRPSSGSTLVLDRAVPPARTQMPEFAFTALPPQGPGETDYRLLTSDEIMEIDAGGRPFLRVDPEGLRLLTETAIHGISHLL